MKFLLCSSGISNPSIHETLVELLGKPIARVQRPLHPDRVQPFPGGPSHVYQFISGTTFSPMCGLGWKSLGVLELTALPSVKPEDWIPAVQETDALLVWAAVPCTCATGCGSPDWPTSCRRCGPRRSMSTRAAEQWLRLPTSEERRTTRVNRSPAATKHWDSLISRCFHTSIARMASGQPYGRIEAWAAGLSVPAYAIDDQTAIKVVDGNVEVIKRGLETVQPLGPTKCWRPGWAP